MNIRITVLAGLIASLLVADVVVVATHDPEPSSSGARSPRTVGPPDRSRSRVSPTDGAVPGARDPARDPAGSSAPLSLPYEPPAPGLYRYATTSHAVVDGRERSAEDVVPYRFSPPRRRAHALEQTVVIGRGEDRLTRTNQWTSAGLFHVRDESARTSGSSCTYQPPKIVVPFPFAVGDTWQPPPAGCRESGGGHPTFGGLAADVEESWRAVRSQRVKVGGRTVETIVFEGTATASFENEEGSGQMRSLTRLWFAPAHRLFVKTYAESEGSFTDGAMPLGGSFSSTASSHLLSLVPA